MVRMFVGFAKILLGVFIKRLFTSERAEIISLSFVFRCASRGCGVNVHTADGVMYCVCHSFSFSLHYASFVRFIEAQGGV